MLHAVHDLRRANRWIVVVRNDEHSQHPHFILELLEARLLLSAAPSADDSADVPNDEPSSINMEFQAVPDFITSAGTSFDNLTLSVFEGPSDLQYQATIQWDDGTQSDGSIVPQSDSRYAVVGSHDYGVKGQFQNVTIHVTASDGSSEDDYRALLTKVQGMEFIEGSEPGANTGPFDLVSGSIASFWDADPADPSAYNVSINWGDGASSTGSVQRQPGGRMWVYGQHTYTSSGVFPMSVTINRPGATLTAPGEAEIDYGSGIRFVDRPNFGFAGTGFTDLPLVSFTGRLSADQYTASVDWGDGTTSYASVAVRDGKFIVVGSHDYSVKGNFLADISIRCPDGSTNDAHPSIIAGADPDTVDRLPGIEFDEPTPLEPTPLEPTPVASPDLPDDGAIDSEADSDVTPIDEPEVIAGFATTARAPERSPLATIASDLFQTHKKISGVLDGADPSEAFLA
jgi:hypothetical protein